MTMHEQNTTGEHTELGLTGFPIFLGREGVGLIERGIDRACKVGAAFVRMATHVETVVGDAMQRRYDK